MSTGFVAERAGDGFAPDRHRGAARKRLVSATLATSRTTADLEGTHPMKTAEMIVDSA